MKPSLLAAIAGLAAGVAHAQSAPPDTPTAPAESVVVTATRALDPAASLRDATVITRDEIEAAGPVSLGELLAREAGIELRATGGPGQPQGLFLRGAGTAQTLVLVDGLRVGSATAGTTSIENIPLEMIERIEVVRGPMSSLWGSAAAGGVVQIFTRGKQVPHLFATAGYGSDRDRRASAGIATADDATNLSLSAGARRVDAPSATNARSLGYFPDRDPYENGFVTLHAAHRLWQGELLALQAFASRSRTDFDAGAAPDGANPGDRSDQTIAGWRFSSSTHFASWWASRLSVGQGRDKLEIHGLYPARFETRQDQATWINEIATAQGTATVGAETVRETVLGDPQVDAAGVAAPAFAHDRRDTHSGFLEIRQAADNQQLEASWRRDEEAQFGSRDTGSVSYGVEWPSVASVAVTTGRGFRAPTFNDLYGPSFPGYAPNPDLLPERSRSRELSVRAPRDAGWRWRLTAFDNRFSDLIVYSPPAGTVLNVASARVRGIEAVLEGAVAKVRWRAALTWQRPRNEDTGARLQGRAGRYGTFEASRAFGAWTAGLVVRASGARFDSADEAPGSRLPGYALVDARVRYVIAKHWSAELSVTNLGDRRYETSVGYDAPRRSVFLRIGFQAF